MPRVPGKMPDLDPLRQAVVNEPDSAEAHFRLGTGLYQCGRIKEAEKECRRALELDPKMVKAWVNLGGILLAAWDFKGCVEANQRAVEIDPDLMQAHFNLGIGHLYLGQAGPMLGCFQKVLKIEPDNAGGHYYQAVAQLALDQVKEARQSLNRATKLGHQPPAEFLRELERKEKTPQCGEQVNMIEFGPNPKDNSTA